MSEWKPIETAPKDGTLIDVWCHADDGDEVLPSVRITDVSWHVADEIFTHTGWMQVMDDGNFDALECPPTCDLGLPEWHPVRWMSRPAPPEDAA